MERRTAGLGGDGGKLKRAEVPLKQPLLLSCSQSAGPALPDLLRFSEARTLKFYVKYPDF